MSSIIPNEQSRLFASPQPAVGQRAEGMLTRRSGRLLRLRPGERSRALVDHAVGLAGDGPKRVCFMPTAVGDAREVIESVSGLFTPCPEVDFSVLTLFVQPSVPDVRAHLFLRAEVERLLTVGASGADDVCLVH